MDSKVRQTLCEVRKTEPHEEHLSLACPPCLDHPMSAFMCDIANGPQVGGAMDMCHGQ